MVAPAKQLKIGELLIAQGVLRGRQVEEILAEQTRSGRPFGDLAERMFGVDPKAVEQAWLDQYLGYDTRVDLRSQPVDPEVLKALSRRQAWQFRILPLRYEHGHLLAATTSDHLRRAINFAWRTLDLPICFLIAETAQLEEGLMKHYPWAAATDLVALK